MIRRHGEGKVDNPDWWIGTSKNIHILGIEPLATAITKKKGKHDVSR